MITLGLETTCDETACGVVKDGKEILSNVIASQSIHREFGGVFPEMASREHVNLLIPVIEESLQQAKISLNEVDLIAVASHPGLMGSLLVGTTAAKALSYGLNKPIISVNHIQAHLYAATMELKNPPFPAIGLILSGGHTSLVYMKNPFEYEHLGSTLDDAIGEAFDKVARLLDLPYPGGPEIEKLAKKGSYTYPFRPCSTKDPYAFSFSGLKTKVLYTLKGQDSQSTPKKTPNKADIAHSFQKAAIDTILQKIQYVCKKLQIYNVYLGGGVSNNQKLRQSLEKEFPDYNIFFPPKGLSLDNGAMIAGLGTVLFQNNPHSENLSFVPTPS